MPPLAIWHSTGQGILAPVDLILGLKDGVALEPGWTLFSAANTYFIAGTSSDSQVGTTAARSGIGLASDQGDSAHSGPRDVNIPQIGGNVGGTDEMRSPSHNLNNVGGHAHGINVFYRPPSARLKLIRATERKPIPLGSIMFGTAANSRQAAYSAMDGKGALEAYASNGSSVAYRAATANLATDDHDHYVNTVTSAMGLYAGHPLSIGRTGAQGHIHDCPTPSVTPNLYRTALRAFEILDRFSIVGLIGMYIGAGVPPKWELVASTNGRFIEITATGAGTQAGNGTVTVYGVTDRRGHVHPTSGVSPYVIVSSTGHVTTVTHGHSYSGTPAYAPERYFMKFIRYVG